MITVFVVIEVVGVFRPLASRNLVPSLPVAALSGTDENPTMVVSVAIGLCSAGASIIVLSETGSVGVFTNVTSASLFNAPPVLSPAPSMLITVLSLSLDREAFDLPPLTWSVVGLFDVCP